MDVDQMPAGREFDFMISEKILGMSCECPHSPASMCRVHDCALYSQDIQAAWVVVEKLKLSLIPNNVGWIVSQHHLFEGPFGEARTAPLAICRAALKAVLSGKDLP